METRIGFGRVVLAGLVAGLVINLCELVMNGWVLGALWGKALADIGITLRLTDAILWGVGSFILGIVGVWIYAASVPRYGPGTKTALRAGIALWAPCFLVPWIGFLRMGSGMRGLMSLALAWGVVEICLAVWVGSRLYPLAPTPARI